MSFRRVSLGVFLLALVTGCAGRRAKSGVEVLNMTEGRVADLVVTRKTTGRREFLFFSFVKETEFLEGFIQGKVLDWEGTPVEGVRIDPSLGEKKAQGTFRSRRARQRSGKRAPFEASYFDSTVSDAGGEYRLRFSVPIVDGIVDVKGEFKYNPGWEQRVEEIGGDYEPHVQNSIFRLYYSKKFRFLVFAEGPREIVVRPRTKAGTSEVPAADGRVKSRGQKSRKQGQDEVEDDPFKNLFE